MVVVQLFFHYSYTGVLKPLIMSIDSLQFYVADMEIHNVMTVEEKDPLLLKKQYHN